MPDLEKIVGWVLRTATTALLGSTGYQLLDGRWFGETIFNTYLQQHATFVLTRPSNTEVFGSFAAQSVPRAIGTSGAVLIFFSLVFLMALFAHVISKPTAAKLRATLQREQAPSAIPRTLTEWKVASRFVWCLYIKFHELTTLGVFVLLASLFFFLPFSPGLAITFLLITIPAALYLLIYAADISRSDFSERFVYVCVFTLLVATVLGWPHLYARRNFDPDFAVASPSEVELDHCDEQELSKGPTFVAFESADEQVLFRVCFDKSGKRKYVDFFSNKGTQRTKRKPVSLRIVLQSFVPPATAP